MTAGELAAATATTAAPKPEPLLIARLTYQVHMMEMNGENYRLKQS